MQRHDTRLFRRFDIFIFVFIIALAASLLIFGIRDEGDTLVVLVGDERTEYSLDENQTFSISNNGIKLTVVIKDGAAFVSKSSCADKICVNKGKIDKAGQMIVCAPAMVSIRVLENGGEFDGITG